MGSESAEYAVAQEAANKENNARDTLKGFGFSREEIRGVMELADFAERLRTEAERRFNGATGESERHLVLGPFGWNIFDQDEKFRGMANAIGYDGMMDWLVSKTGPQSYFDNRGGKEAVSEAIRTQVAVTYANAAKYLASGSPLHEEAKSWNVSGVSLEM